MSQANHKRRMFDVRAPRTYPPPSSLSTVCTDGGTAVRKLIFDHQLCFADDLLVTTSCTSSSVSRSWFPGSPAINGVPDTAWSCALESSFGCEHNQLAVFGWPCSRIPDGDLGPARKRSYDKHRANCGTRASLADFGLGQPTLFTASVAVEDAGRSIHAFAALLAVDEVDALRRLRSEHALESKGLLLRAGFDPSEPIASELLSLPLVEILLDADDDPGSPLAAGLNIYLEHQFDTWKSGEV